MNLRELVQPTNTAVIVIDMQNDYVHRDGASLRYFRDKNDGREINPETVLSAAEKIVPSVIEFAGVARAVKTNIVWVRTVNNRYTVSRMAARQGKNFAWSDDEWGTAFYEGLQPLGDEPIVTKQRHSGFFATNLDAVLRSLGAATIVLTGVSTPYCVEGTARDGFAFDYDVITVSNCTASKVESEHEAALSRLGRTFGVVATSEEIISAWS
ncbi:MAG: cysteine hydrolase [Anaerolineales bacterium]|nr:cysteine hydrolase [Anaerolineales bacterium]